MRFLAAAVAGLLIAPGVAHAGTVSAGLSPETNLLNINMKASPGEANDVRVQKFGGAVVVADAGAPLTPGDSCVAIEAGRVSCSIAGASDQTFVSLELGDRNDVARVGDLADMRDLRNDDFFEGGAGDDRLFGGPSDDAFYGGAGRDRIRGRAGNDNAILEGGRVTVDLAGGLPGGATGSRDQLRGVEKIVSGDSDDVLRGDAGSQTFEGAGGDDVIDGRGGDDVLVGDGGDDRLNGGAGDDRVFGGGDRDIVRGGPGDDTLGNGDDPEADPETYGRFLAGERVLGGPGDDTLFVDGTGTAAIAGPGDDDVHASPLVTTIDCGPGRDTADSLIGSRLFPPSCERMRLVELRGRPVVAGRVLRRGASHITLKTFGAASQHVVASVWARGRLLGRRGVEIGGGRVVVLPGTLPAGVSRVEVRLERFPQSAERTTARLMVQDARRQPDATRAAASKQSKQTNTSTTPASARTSSSPTESSWP